MPPAERVSKADNAPGARDSEGQARAALELLLARAARGESEAWRSIVAEFAPRIHGLLRSQCRDIELAEEITQSTFCTVAAKIGDYVESGRFESWVFRIAVNRLRDEMRRRARHAKPMGDEGLEAARGLRGVRSATRGSDDGGVAAAERRARLEEALARLTEADREIIELRHTGGMSFKALSDYYQEPLGTLLARHHRALKKLRGNLEALGVDAGDLGGGGEE